MSESFDADVVIVGAGIGGLTAGAYLQALGKRTIVVDRHYVVGGNVSSFTHHDYEFDVGTHYLGECQPGGLTSMVYDGVGLGDAIDWRQLDPGRFDRYFFPDATYEVPAGLEAYAERLCEWFPDEADSVRRFTGFLDDVSDAFGAAMSGRHSDRGAVLLEYRDRTLGSLFDEWGMSARLRAVLAAQHGLYGVGPARASALLHALVVTHYMHGAYYPAGGGQRLSDILADSIVARGGDVILRTPVESIIVEDGRAVGVRLRPPSPERRRGVPTELRAPVVLSNADLKRTVLELAGPDHFPADFVNKVSSMRMGPPMFVAYLVLDRDLGKEGFPNSNAFVFERDDIDSEYEAIARGELLDHPNLFCSFASLKDPGNTKLCRPGQSNLEVMTLVPPEYAFWGLERGPAAGERYRLNAEYRNRKQALTDALLAGAERAIPGLRDSVVYCETATPITHERFVRSSGGTSYGFEMTPDQALDRRPMPVSPLPGLFLCGQGIVTGHGIAACMAGGIMAASAISGAPIMQMLRRGERVAEPLPEPVAPAATG